MNIWEELAGLESRITDKTLRAAWARMVQTRSPADCVLVQEIADDTDGEYMFWRLALCAEEYATIEQSLAHLLIKVTAE
jgi:hypothetical protein